jgi:hypothetical protein
MGHDVAPMASRVTDGNEEGFILGLCLRKGRFTPRQPMHGVFGVLAQIKTAGGVEFVWHWAEAKVLENPAQVNSSAN